MENAVKMINVSSSTIHKIGYDEDAKRLTVVFNSGVKYTYANVPKELWKGLQEAKSTGQFFIREIKQQFRGVKRGSK